MNDNSRNNNNSKKSKVIKEKFLNINQKKKKSNIIIKQKITNNWKDENTAIINCEVNQNSLDNFKLAIKYLYIEKEKFKFRYSLSKYISIWKQLIIIVLTANVELGV